MKQLFSKPLYPYVIGMLVIVLSAGGILSLITTEYIVLISVLAIVYFILITITLYVFEKYIKPLDKANKVVDHLVKGNYRSRIHHPANGTIGVLSSKINALARNLSELSIQEQMQAEQLSTVIDNTESGLVLIGEKGYIHLVNRKFLSMFGNVAKDYIGYLYYEVLDQEEIHQIVQDTFLYEKNIKGTFSYVNNLKKHYEIVGAPIFNERNTLKGTVLVIYDITELKKLEMMRKDFIANVSHELKDPIGLLAKNSNELLSHSLNKEQQESLIQTIYRESGRLELLLGDLLTLTKLEREDFQLNVTNVHMNNLIDEVIPSIQKRLRKANISLSVKIEEDQMIRGDVNKLRQIISNLLGNAISYTYDDGEITLEVQEVDHYLLIRVEDTGIGIANKDLARVSERFYRVNEARSRNTGGTGLGLAIVKHITEVHDGYMTVESELTKGTTFSIYLPKF